MPAKHAEYFFISLYSLKVLHLLNKILFATADYSGIGNLVIIKLIKSLPPFTGALAYVYLTKLENLTIISHVSLFQQILRE